MVPLLSFIPSLISGVKEYVGKKQDLQKLKRNASIKIETAKVEAQIRRIESSDAADVKLDALSLEQTGWKDEYLLILTTLPLISIMISPYLDLAVAISSDDFVYQNGMLATAVGSGFDEMKKLPEYYWYALGGVYIHSLGMRRMFRQLLEKSWNPFSK